MLKNRLLRVLSQLLKLFLFNLTINLIEDDCAGTIFHFEDGRSKRRGSSPAVNVYIHHNKLFRDFWK